MSDTVVQVVGSLDWIASWPVLEFDHLSDVIKRLPMNVVAAMKREPGLWLAGGFIRAVHANEAVRDIDLFVSGELAIITAKRLSTGGYQHEETLTFKDHEHKLFKLDSHDGVPEIQLCVGWEAATPGQLINEFDFTVCKAAVWHDGSDWRSVRHPDFYDHIKVKQLVIDNQEACPSLMRMVRYCRRGYDIDEGTVRFIVAGECAKALAGQGMLAGEPRYVVNSGS